jgi:GTPase SAR1 family protein
MFKNEEKNFKILVVGNSSTGKSSIIERYVNNNFKSNYISTIGVDFSVKTIILNNIKINLQIWGIF